MEAELYQNSSTLIQVFFARNDHAGGYDILALLGDVLDEPVWIKK